MTEQEIIDLLRNAELSLSTVIFIIVFFVYRNLKDLLKEINELEIT